MRYQELGNTGLKVSALGLGTAALGRPGYINVGHAADLSGKYERSSLEQHLHQMLQTAWEAGICYFDTARSYGEAERFVASWLHNKATDEVHLASKWGYSYTAGWQIRAKVHEKKDHSVQHLQKQWQESHQLLGSYLKVYQIHSATPESKVLQDKKVLDELRRLKGEGVKIGLTTSGPEQAALIEQAIEIPADQGLLFDCVQATWNLLETSAATALMKARAAGLGVVIKEALANGRLSNRYREPEFEEQAQSLQRQAQALSTTPESLALAAALAQPFADVVLCGAATLDHLRENIRAASLPWDRALMIELSALAEAPEAYWKRRAKLPWN